MSVDYTRVLRLTNSASDISGYKRSYFTPRTGDEVTLTAAANSGSGEVALEEWSTDITGLTSWPAGDWSMWLYACVDAGSAYLKAYVYQRASDGAETLLGSAVSTIFSDVEPALQLFAVACAAATPTVKDRIVVKLKVLSDTVTDVVVSLYLLGTARESRVLTPFDISTAGNMTKAVYDPEGDGTLPGGGGSAADITVDVSGFTGNLAGVSPNVQASLAVVDQLTTGASASVAASLKVVLNRSFS